ncbi:lysozyme inhibitor LprI family protein [Aliarcobacter lanthieri]|uniref:lysozyme inhibitor LprI family protein n=1 Tax=Aliarcobacter lanthieri TaxID=1355374 RepID=UPI003AAAD0B4
MKQISIILIFFVNLIYAQNIEFYTPSFSCNNIKKDSVEYKICIDEILSLQDSILTNIYNSLIKLTKLNINKLKDEQKTWLINRNQCKDYKCITVSYEERIKQLNYIYALFIKNDFLALERINISNPDEEQNNITLKYSFVCKPNKDLPIIARDKDFYFIEELSNYQDRNFVFFVKSNFIDEVSNEQILKGTLMFDGGETYQPTAIEFFTYSKNWDCKLETYKY